MGKNPLYGQFGGGMPQMPGNMGNVISQFNQFRSNYNGNAQQQVQELLNSGKMTQGQFNQLRSMASQFQQLLGK